MTKKQNIFSKPFTDKINLRNVVLVVPGIIDIKKNQNMIIKTSKLFGYPFWPKNSIESYPRDIDGNPMLMLAQVNIKDLPYLDHRLPADGMIQFYLSVSENEHNSTGTNLDTDNKTNRYFNKVVYFNQDKLESNYEDLTSIKNELSLKFKTSGYNFPVQNEILNKNFLEDSEFNLNQKKESNIMNFKSNIQPMSFSTSKFKTEYPDISKNEAVEEQYFNLYKQFITTKLFGYPDFIQSDPFMNTDSLILLMQFNSYEFNMLWGDGGIASFFIHPDDLENLNFEKVLFTWDSY